VSMTGPIGPLKSISVFAVLVDQKGKLVIRRA
jgi:hypothetical protein